MLALRQHQWIGWGVFSLACVHVALSMLSDHVALEHLRLSTPAYEWAGIAALLLLGLLSPLGVAALRRRLWRNHRRFQAVHVAAACALIPAVAAHALTTGHFVRGAVEGRVFVMLCILALAALLRVRRGAGADQGLFRLSPAWLVFGRHSGKLLVMVVLALLMTGSLFSARASITLRESMQPRHAALEVAFPHEQHREVSCITCHHNFVDRTGTGSCYACHRSGRSDLRVGAEARFHDFCLGCHRDPPQHFERAGPVTGCSVCHHAATAPSASE